MATNEGMLAIKHYVAQMLADDPTGHDYEHMKRVAAVASQLAEKEGADELIAEMAGWLHDVADSKLTDDPQAATRELIRFLTDIGVPKLTIEQIIQAIEDVSFSKGNVPTTLEGKIVQDADRLDAIGAVGIARTFAFGGAHGQLIHTDTKDGRATSIQHVYNKLVKVASLMNTAAAKREANKRHHVLIDFLEHFHEEWEGRID
ncbi:HD domain-containing protein [Thalassobacillus sp. CUG 92003]|uniref:HD domain-containing protein n=1 Tax=Thalassobacillus sp. CUG 92003 TaxID=2736641 RepID=UPI0015E74AE1|nr:HD domain-containing protein [Thalassobacillus sp. CUG 92003]